RDAGLDAAQVRALEAARPSPHARDWLAVPGQRLLGWHDPDYPALLRRMPAPPLGLFVAGDAGLLWHPCVAVVGTRAPTAGGRDHARGFATALARAGLGVCSGLAAGIDTVAHGAALEAGGATIAVLGSGLDRPYPRANAGLLREVAARGVAVSEHPPGTGARREHFPARNRIIAGLSLGTLVVEAAHRSGALITARLAADAGRGVFARSGSGLDRPYPRANAGLLREVAARGVAVSEHPPGTGARREHFPARNRIIAGLSLGTLVVEAAHRSGALITARLAADAGREVFAIPGSIRNPMARGCHRLLRDGAVLVEEPAEVVPALGPVAQALADALRTRLQAPINAAGHACEAVSNASPRPDPDYQRLWSALGHDPSPMDQLLERTGLTAAQASSMLLLMEL